MLEMKHVSKSFDGFKALDDLNLTVPKGSIYGLVGPNGAGKSTAIRILTGVYRPTEGEVSMEGMAIYENPMTKQRIGYKNAEEEIIARVHAPSELTRQIEAGVLSPGDKLPSVRELSASLTINPNTIQRAYRELENDGWIESAPGKGSFVRLGMRNGDKQQWQELDNAVRGLLSRGVALADITAHITGGERNG